MQSRLTKTQSPDLALLCPHSQSVGALRAELGDAEAVTRPSPSCVWVRVRSGPPPAAGAPRRRAAGEERRRAAKAGALGRAAGVWSLGVAARRSLRLLERIRRSRLQPGLPAGEERPFGRLARGRDCAEVAAAAGQRKAAS